MKISSSWISSRARAVSSIDSIWASSVIHYKSHRAKAKAATMMAISSEESTAKEWKLDAAFGMLGAGDTGGLPPGELLGVSGTTPVGKLPV